MGGPILVRDIEQTRKRRRNRAMPPSVVVPTTILRDDYEQKRPVCTPTSKKRRQLKKTTKVKYENEDPHPPLGLFFGGMWVAPMTNQHEQHGDHSTPPGYKTRGDSLKFICGFLSKVGGKIFVCSKLVGFCKSGRCVGQVHFLGIGTCQSTGSSRTDDPVVWRLTNAATDISPS